VAEVTYACWPQSIHLEYVARIFQASKTASKAPHDANVEPLAEGDVTRIDQVSDGEELRWIRVGFNLIAEVHSTVSPIPEPCYSVACRLAALRIHHSGHRA
jgi:hypothetical protein